MYTVSASAYDYATVVNIISIESQSRGFRRSHYIYYTTTDGIYSVRHIIGIIIMLVFNIMLLYAVVKRTRAGGMRYFIYLRVWRVLTHIYIYMG